MKLTADFFGTEIQRLIIGDNPFNGHSYIEDEISGKEMVDYYTSGRLYDTLFEIEQTGIDCMLPLADPFVIRIIREYQRDGGRMKFIFQPYMPMNQQVSMRQMAEVGPIGIYHQGTTTDYLYETNQVDVIRKQIAEYKTMGIPVGVGTHRPEVIELSENEGWGADFYLACLQNARIGREKSESGFLTGKTKSQLLFYPHDRPKMLEVIRKTKKPCIAFKIFAGGQMFVGKDAAAVEEAIKAAYREVFTAVKPDDFAAIGIFQKYKNQLNQDIRLFHEVMENMKQNGKVSFYGKKK